MLHVRITVCDGDRLDEVNGRVKKHDRPPIWKIRGDGLIG